jgi:hypothetical protein
MVRECPCRGGARELLKCVLAERLWSGWRPPAEHALGAWTHYFSPALSAVNAKNNSGNTPLHYAAINNRLRAARLLLENKADANAQNRVRARCLATHPTLPHASPQAANPRPRRRRRRRTPRLARRDANTSAHFIGSRRRITNQLEFPCGTRPRAVEP